MKQYYYAENGQQFGPFTAEELTVKKIKKETLVWYDGLSDWVSACEVDELKSILVPTPPPLPKPLKEDKEKSKKPEVNIIVKKPQHQEDIPNNSNYEYEKEYYATFLGFFWAALFLILNITNIINGDNARSIWVIILFVIQVLSTIMAVGIAKRQNRNTFGWGLFTFGTPSLSLIILGLLNKKRLKIELDGSIPQKEQIAILLDKVVSLKSDGRYPECIEIINKILEIDNSNEGALIERGIIYLQMNKLEDAQTDFTAVADSEFKSDSYYYLGEIERNRKNINRAIELWEISEREGNQSANKKLYRYRDLRGIYELSEKEIKKKVGDESFGNTTLYKKGFFTMSTVSYKKGFSRMDNIGKRFDTEITICHFGIYLKLNNIFKSYHFGITFSEIENVIYQEDTETLLLFLFGNIILEFSCRKDNPILQKLCSAEVIK